MSVTGNVRPPNRTLGTLVAGYFKNDSHAKKAVAHLRDKGIPGDQIGIAMRQDEIPRHEGWISEVRDILGKSETLPQNYETTRETFTGIGLEDRAAAHFEQQIEDQGGVVVGVRCDSSRAPEVESILREDGADVARENLQQQPRTAGATSQATRSAQPRREGQRIQLMGEMLRAQKERINRGEVRLRKETVTEHQTVSVPVTREEVVIEQRPASGAPAGRIGENKEIRIPVSEERARVEKEPVVLGEVTAQKREVTGTQQVGGEVRHEEVKVEKQGNVEDVVTDKTSKTGKDKKVA